MREIAQTFGTGRTLVGIVTEPAPSARRPGSPALLLANVGMHHRIGPYRLFVDLARRLAELGFTTLRFDLAGLGDSGAHKGGVVGTDEARWNADMKAAMTLLQDQHQARSFVVLGLCSGVDPAHAIALADPRIRGAIFVDGHAFFTPMHYVHRYVFRAAKPRAWELFLKRRAPRLFGVAKEDPAAANLAFARPPMPRPRFIRELARLLEQEIPLLFAFTGEQNHVFSHAEQFHDMVRPLETRGRIDVSIYPRADHTLSIPEDRRAFVGAMARWLAEKFPMQASSRPDGGELAPVSEVAVAPDSKTRIRSAG
jgi:dienelactone hydrolase